MECLSVMSMFVKSERFCPELINRPLGLDDRCFTEYGDRRAGEGDRVAARRRARDAASPSHVPPAPTAGPGPFAHSVLLAPSCSSSAPTVKTERQSPHDSTASRSRSVTPSTSSYPGTPPERGSPHAPAPAPALPPRNYSDIMRSLAARYNPHPANEFFNRANGLAYDRPPVTVDNNENISFVGLVSCLTKQRSGGAARSPVNAKGCDMSMSKYMSSILRNGGRNRRRRLSVAFPATEHSPLDLSAAGETAAKRARLSPSTSSRSDGDDRERSSNEDRCEIHECLCAETRARLSAWSVDEVYDFVNSIDICAEYATNFREQRIDGSGLPLLTEDHLTGMLKMKLGPALKLRSVVARKLESCAQCVATAARLPRTSTPLPATNTVKVNGTSVKSEPRSNTTSPS